MQASQHLKILSVRLPESEVRRFKSLAASRGISVQEAVHEALQAWASEARNTSTEPLDALEGSLGDVDVVSLMRQEKEAELRKDRRRY
jgi:Ribbon-helix-helix protein, copG family